MKDAYQNFNKIIKKIPQNFTGIAWKSVLYSSLFLCWTIIIFGTYLLLK